jgi:indolepyruvate ferredoxin oxidoreductase
MALAAVTLDDKYALEQGRVYLTGVQALVRLILLQRQRDAAAGLNTGGFVSGYRGSPLGGFDKALWEAKRFLKSQDVQFQPGVNEELAATAIWGSQQLNLYPGSKKDGVFGVWYGKGPGVDRTGDVFKHANSAGTDPNGGVLALAGDDHACKSSTLAHQSELALIDAMIPILNPAGVQEILDYGIYGWALSRYAGVWVGMKTIAESMDSSASVTVDPARVQIILPEDVVIPPGGFNIRPNDAPLDQEHRLHRYKIPAVLAFARANRLDRVMLTGPQRRLGIVTVGKSYLDVREALVDLGLSDREATELGLCVYKVAMPWPLEPEGLRAFARGLDSLLVVEEKRGVIEQQVKEKLYDLPDAERPRIVGKQDEAGQWLLPSDNELSSTQVAIAIATRLLALQPNEKLSQRLEILRARQKRIADKNAAMSRIPTFCSGCPHNSSTKLPEGSRALAGIGCHYMAIWMDRETSGASQMGGEGVAWIGQEPFTETPHVFANIGDGTYYHSGYLAIRQAVAAKANITYKILFNDAVAMTGGQPVDGQMTVPQITQQLAAEGVSRIVVVSDEPEKYPIGAPFAHGVTVEHRADLDRVQRDLRELPGVTALVYDQTCATEKRRRRKRGTLIDPPRRVVINESVCEGCGDCGAQSNCVSLLPVETEFGRKRQIDQSTCNKDMSCVNGFCPSFVTVEGGKLRKPKAVASSGGDFADLPEPAQPSLDRPWNVLVNGVGGTGVVTIGALLGMAAHLEGKGVSVLDMTGLAQKGGAVMSHIRIANRSEDIQAVRVAAGTADLVIGADFITSGGSETLARAASGRTHLVINEHRAMPSDFTRHPDLDFPAAALRRSIEAAAGPEAVTFLDATGIATALLGDSIATNLFLMGFAAQRGLIPLSTAAIERAVELNNVAVDFNKRAFLWGRRAAVDLEAVKQAARPADSAIPAHRKLSESLDQAIARRAAYLASYQNQAWAERYQATVARVRAVENKAVGGENLAAAVARYLFKLMSYKDEYEVARLHSDKAFLGGIAAQFEGDYKLAFNLAPPLLAERDPTTGHLKKRRFGPWMGKAFGLLHHLKGLRGTAFDIFGYTAERRMERQLIADYEKLIDELLQRLTPQTLDLAVSLAAIPERIRGYGHVKERHLAEAKALEQTLLAQLRSPQDAPMKAAAE